MYPAQVRNGAPSVGEKALDAKDIRCNYKSALNEGADTDAPMLIGLFCSCTGCTSGALRARFYGGRWLTLRQNQTIKSFSGLGSTNHLRFTRTSSSTTRFYHKYVVSNASTI